MKPSERDEMLIRIDEKVRALKDGDKGDVPDIKRHFEKQDDKIVRNSTMILRNKIMIYSLIAFLSGAGILDATVFHKVFGG